MVVKLEIVSDLHTHSSCSDGFWTPSEVVLKAKEAGLKQISIADHNTISGVSEALKKAKAVGVDFIKGAEINAQTNYEGEIFHNHILAYNFDEKKFSVVVEKIVKSNNDLFIEIINRLKVLMSTKNDDLISKRHPFLVFKKNIDVNSINEQNILKDEYTRLYLRKINDEEVKVILKEKFLPPEIISRFIKNNLIENPEQLVKQEPRFWAKKIIFKNLPEVFSILDENNSYQNHEFIINSIIDCKGIPILAHPFLDYANYSLEKREKYDRFLNELILKKLGGFEIYYYIGQGSSEQQQKEFNEKSEKLCKKNKLQISFGSDCHGPKRGDTSRIFLGKFGGNRIIQFN